MLTLICGLATAAARSQLVAPFGAEETLFVVPNELSARALAGEINSTPVALSGERQIINSDALIHRLTGDMVDERNLVSPDIARAMIRNILDTAPNSFDYLVGRNSVPRMSQGVLERITSSLGTIQGKVSGEEDPAMNSARGRQLKLLALKMDERLAIADVRLENYALLEAVSCLGKAQWDKYFPSIQRIVFLDFSDYSDLVFLLIAAATKSIPHCDVLLDFDPEDDNFAQSAMEAAYIRLYDMADSFALTPGDLKSIPGAPPGLASLEVPPLTSVVVTATTVSQEIAAAVAVVDKLLKDAPIDASPSVVIALPGWHDYAPGLEKALGEYGIDSVWEQTDSPVNGGEFLLLDRLRNCSGKYVDGSALGSLFRAPEFPSLLKNGVTAVEAWNLASRLDYILTLTGRLQGWKSITTSVQSMLQRLQSSRRRNGQWTEEEELLDTALLDLLNAVQDVTKRFSRKASVVEWCKDTTAILGQFSKDSGPDIDLRFTDFTLARVRALKRSLRQMASAGTLISPGDIDFRYFMSLFRTVVNKIRLDNLDEMQSVLVTVCSPSTAATMRSDCCIVLGCNDGNFPKFARPDASFLNYSFHTNQTGYRVRQRITLERILRNHSRCLLWQPAKVGTEDLLPSQFIENLLESGQCSEVTTTDLLDRMGIGPASLGRQANADFVENLKGLILTDGELKRFRQRGSMAFNVAANISVIASRSRPKLSSYDGIILDPNLQTWLADWTDRHIYSVSQLDAVVGCSFRFFVQRMLNLEELDEADNLLPSHVFGSFTHDVLARFYRDWVAEGRDVPGSDDEALSRQKLLMAYEKEHSQFPELSDFAMDLLNLKLFGEFGPGEFGASSTGLAETKDPGVFGQFLLMEMQRGSDPAAGFLKPSNFEVGFGMGRLEEDDPLSKPDHLELDLGEGERIKLRGRIDRIDLSPTGVFAVTDYKTGMIPEKREILGGYRTQLPVYMMVGEQLLKSQFENPEAAGGLYYSLKKGNKAKVSGIFFRSAYQQQAGVTGRSCLKDDEFESALTKVQTMMRSSLKAVKRGYLTTTRHAPEAVCRYCPFEGLCYRDVDRTEKFWQAVESGTEAGLI